MYSSLKVCSKDNSIVKTSDPCITQLAKVTTDPEFVDLTADLFIVTL